MTNIREFIMSDGRLSDGDLVSMIRGQMPSTNHDRRGWLKQIELSLDGYGRPTQLSAAARIRLVLRDLERELDPVSALPVT